MNLEQRQLLIKVHDILQLNSMIEERLSFTSDISSQYLNMFGDLQSLVKYSTKNDFSITQPSP